MKKYRNSLHQTDAAYYKSHKKSTNKTGRQAILKTAQLSQYLVQFEIDECVSIIQHKHLLDPPIPSIGDVCSVQWSGEEYCTNHMAMGDEATVKKAQVDSLTSLDDAETENNKPARKEPKPPTKVTKEKTYQWEDTKSEKENRKSVP